jgi:hypothetical protein
MLVGLVVLVALPPLLLALSSLGSGWLPVDTDRAAMFLRTREVGTSRTPLVGAYSRYGWDHPGPLLFWVCAPAVRLFGPEGLLFTAGLVNATAAATAVWAAHRIGRLALAAPTAVAVAVLMHAITLWGLVEPWNPYVAALPFVAYLICVWGAANGDRVLLPLAVVAGSWSTQAHLSYVPMTLAAAGLALAWRLGHRLAWRRRRRRQDRIPPESAVIPRAWLAGAAIVGFLLWLPPLTDQVSKPHGNLEALLFFARTGIAPDGTESKPIGLDQALPAVGGLFGPNGAWMHSTADPKGFLLPPEGSFPTALLLMAVFAVVGILAWNRGHHRAAGLIGMALSLEGLSVVAIAHTADDLLGYLLRWAWGIAALGWIAAAWAVLELIGPRWRQLVPTLACLAVVALGFFTLGDGLVPDFRDNPGVAAVDEMSDQLLAQLDPDVTYLLNVEQSDWYYLVMPGIAANLIAHGQPIVVNGGLRNMFKDWLIADSRPYPEVVILPSDIAVTWQPLHPAATRIATYTPRSPAELADPLFTPHDAWLVPADRPPSGF